MQKWRKCPSVPPQMSRTDARFSWPETPKPCEFGSASEGTELLSLHPIRVDMPVAKYQRKNGRRKIKASKPHVFLPSRLKPFISHAPFLDTLLILRCRVLPEFFESLLIPIKPQPLHAHRRRHILQGTVVPPLLSRIQSPHHLLTMVIVGKVKSTRNQTRRKRSQPNLFPFQFG